MKNMKLIVRIICVLIVFWVIMLGTDYWKTTHDFEKPVFALCSNGADDGGSGTYKNIGYYIEIKGNFMPEDEFPGVTQAQFNIFGKPVTQSIRE
ncbi:MAG: hypothetical protein U9N81_13705 [Bacillota bacterium]|nr:hypothetical protein [Bacillota bacterium]